VEEAQRQIDSRQFVEWMAYLRICPTGDDWHQAGTIAAAVYNVARDPKKGKPVMADDFVPRMKEPPKPMSGDAMAAVFFAAMKDRIVT
jgi:hypothetical protein